MERKARPGPGRALALASRALPLAVATALLTATPAVAARVVVFSGGGWGHGIGMSQYGAYGLASSGWTAGRIVAHYYRGTSVGGRDMPSSVRVGLLQRRSAIEVRSWERSAGSGRVAFKLAGSSEYIASGGPDVTWSVRPSATGGIKLFKNDLPVVHGGRVVFGSPSRPVVLVYRRFGSIVRVLATGRRYAYGNLQFAAHRSSACSGGYCVRLVLPLGMQQYLYGLGEMPSSWPLEALKAQTLAARTYAYRRIRTAGQHRAGCDCALSDTPADQAYVGDAKRDANGDGVADTYWWRWKRAVDETRGRVILYGGAPIEALYMSSSGGHTENNENVWGGTPVPYLRGVPDGADRAGGRNPNYRWRREIPWGALSRRLNSSYRTGWLKSVAVVPPRGVSGRVTVVKPGVGGGVRIVGSNRTVRVSGWSLRSALGLKDTLFTLSVISR